MKGISLVIIYTSCISVSKTQDIDLDGEVSDKVEWGWEERTRKTHFNPITMNYCES